ncbi:hypothetical protein HC928_06230 [bacterium]|nr:hypothetical protein [bacterium]
MATKIGLSEAELLLGCLVVLGLDNKEIAELLQVHRNTVDQRVYRLRQKLGLPHREALFRYMVVAFCHKPDRDNL